jgi:hypothetical protein
VPKECFGKIEGNCFRIFEGKSGIFVLLATFSNPLASLRFHLYSNSRLYLSDDDIPERACGGWYLRGMWSRILCI